MARQISKKEKRLELQENSLISEINEIEIEICTLIQKIIAAHWNAPSLMSIVEQKISQRQIIRRELDFIWGFK
jgi:hypothetical protein